jgi:cullin 3
VPTVYDLGLSLFRANIARNAKIKDRLLKVLLANIQRERSGEVIARSLMKNVTQMLVDLGIGNRAVYEEDFERQFLEASSLFYRVESQNFIAENSCSDYMKKVEQRIKEEMERVQHYLDAATEAKIKEVVERELITVHMKSLVEVRQFTEQLRCRAWTDTCHRWRARARLPCSRTTRSMTSRECTTCSAASRADTT